MGVVGWLRNRTSRLRFWAAAARKNCSRTNFSLRRRKRRSPDLILQFREQRFHFFSLPLCLGKLWCVRQLPSALSGRFVHVDGKKAKCAAGTLGF